MRLSKEELQNKIEVTEKFYNQIAKENNFNRKLAREVLAKIKRYKTLLATLS